MSFIRSTCKFCHAAIIWAKTKADRFVPIDFEPVDRGFIILYVDLGSTKVQAISTKDFAKDHGELLPLYRDRYVPHGTTCTARPQ